METASLTLPQRTRRPHSPRWDFLRRAALHCGAGVVFSLAGFKVGKQGSVSWRMSLEIKLDSETNTSELDASPTSPIARPCENKPRQETPPASRLGQQIGPPHRPLLPVFPEVCGVPHSLCLSFGRAGRAGCGATVPACQPPSLGASISLLWAEPEPFLPRLKGLLPKAGRTQHYLSRVIGHGDTDTLRLSQELGENGFS